MTIVQKIQQEHLKLIQSIHSVEKNKNLLCYLEAWASFSKLMREITQQMRSLYSVAASLPNFLVIQTFTFLHPKERIGSGHRTCRSWHQSLTSKEADRFYSACFIYNTIRFREGCKYANIQGVFPRRDFWILQGKDGNLHQSFDSPTALEKKKRHHPVKTKFLANLRPRHVLGASSEFVAVCDSYTFASRIRLFAYLNHCEVPFRNLENFTLGKDAASLRVDLPCKRICFSETVLFQITDNDQAIQRLDLNNYDFVKKPLRLDLDSSHLISLCANETFLVLWYFDDQSNVIADFWDSVELVSRKKYRYNSEDWVAPIVYQPIRVDVSEKFFFIELDNFIQVFSMETGRQIVEDHFPRSKQRPEQVRLFKDQLLVVYEEEVVVGEWIYP